MATSFRYADYLKIIENNETHNPTTIVQNAEEAGLLQKQFEEAQQAQQEKTRGVEQTRKNWPKHQAELFPESTEEQLTIEDIRRRSHGSIRSLHHRKRGEFPESPDGLASNGQRGWLGYRWKKLLPRESWTDEEWEEFQRELTAWEAENDTTCEHKIRKSIEKEGVARKKGKPKRMMSVGLAAVIFFGMIICNVWKSMEVQISHEKADDLYTRALDDYKSRRQSNQMAYISFPSKDLILQQAPPLYEGLEEPHLLASADRHPFFPIPNTLLESPP